MNKMVYINKTLYMHTDEARLIAAGAPGRDGRAVPQKLALSLTQTAWRVASSGAAKSAASADISMFSTFVLISSACIAPSEHTL
ncbi:MAG: hypothetical protein LBB61_07920 [Treponema sp.]|nr:hypothetical protein [Treponema sp.]